MDGAAEARLQGIGQRTEGVDDHNTRPALFHFFDDPLQSTFQTALDRIIGQVDEADALVHLLRVEKGVLLLVPQHLDRWLAENREEEAVRSGVAFSKTNCCARVVFPVPGAPATRLNEPSGTPPPRMTSSPGTPLGSFSITTFFPDSFVDLPGAGRLRPELADGLHAQILAEQHDEQVEQVRQYGGGGRRRLFVGARRQRLRQAGEARGWLPAHGYPASRGCSRCAR
jgi:hypothetical protein